MTCLESRGGWVAGSDFPVLGQSGCPSASGVAVAGVAPDRMVGFGIVDCPLLLYAIQYFMIRLYDTFETRCAGGEARRVIR